MEDTKVEVCDGVLCSLCGVISDVRAGQWSVVTCAGTLRGTMIKLTDPTQNLNICEIKMFGQGLVSI